MKSRIISLGLVASLVCLLPQVAEAQIAASNPLEWTALAEGNELINGQIEKQIKGQTQTAPKQHRYRVQPNPQVGEAVQQLPQDSKRLRFITESLYASLQ